MRKFSNSMGTPSYFKSPHESEPFNPNESIYDRFLRNGSISEMFNRHKHLQYVLNKLGSRFGSDKYPFVFTSMAFIYKKF